MPAYMRWRRWPTWTSDLLPPETLRRRINEELPADINILAIDSVPHRFHARHDAVSRTYLYQIATRRTAFAKPYVWWVRDELDLDRMRTVAAALRGFNDFASFTDDDPDEKSTDVSVIAAGRHRGRRAVLIRIEGSHFLWKMVRRIVGVLVNVGIGSLAAGEVDQFLRRRSDLPARLTAPASGLFLERVTYRADRPAADPPPFLFVR